MSGSVIREWKPGSQLSTGRASGTPREWLQIKAFCRCQPCNVAIRVSYPLLLAPLLVNALRDHLTLLLFCLAPLVAAALVRIDDERVIVPILDLALPTVCWSRRWFDVACPGCGLTRGTIAAMHGDFAAAWTQNPAVFVVIATLAYQVGFRSVQIWRIQRGQQPLRRGSGGWMLWVCLAAMLAQWVTRH
jgi:hypothetical protein